MKVKQLKKILGDFSDEADVFMTRFLEIDSVEVYHIHGAADNSGNLQLECYESEKAQKRVFEIRDVMKSQQEEGPKDG